MTIDFLKTKKQQIDDEIVSVLVKWTLADRVEYDPSSHRKMRVKARRDKERFNVELRKLIVRLDYLQDNAKELKINKQV